MVLHAPKPYTQTVNRVRLQAEAFAALVNSGLIGIAGAVKTIVALLKKPDNRSAAITCLGKTAELCMEQVRLFCACIHAFSGVMHMCTSHRPSYSCASVNMHQWQQDQPSFEMSCCS